jgi:glycosyltransferase involved in cell wall biosynthesis
MKSQMSPIPITLLYDGFSITRADRFIFELRKKIRAHLKNKPETRRGPASVRDNLILGLERINFPFQLSPVPEIVSEHVGVLSDPQVALPWAIQAKREGKISKLIAGPNLVVLPEMNDKIICSEEIDDVVVPSDIVKNLYIERAPELTDKIKVWPVGIDTDFWLPENKANANCLLVYEKILDEKDRYIYEHVIKRLDERRQDYRVMHYGKFTREEYLGALQAASAMIYLTEAESQGIAILEAWSTNIPTLVWDREYWEKDSQCYPFSSAPYLTEQCGLKFKTIDDYCPAFEAFVSNLQKFRPREFALERFTVEKTAMNYIELFA